MATPIGLALLFLMAAAPALPWRATSGEVVRNRLLVPAWIGGLTMLAAVMLGARGLAEVLAYGLGAFATAGIVRQFVLGIRGRRRALGESRAVALGRATRSNPRLYGGLVVHFGVVLIAVVLAASSAYGANRDVKLRRGQSATVSGYTLTYLGSHTARSDQKVTVSADVRVAKGDRVLGTYSPAISTYPEQHRGHRHAVGAHRRRRRRLPHARVVAERAAARHARGADQPDDRVALDRRRLHGVGDDPRAVRHVFGDGSFRTGQPSPQPEALEEVTV